MSKKNRIRIYVKSLLMLGDTVSCDEKQAHYLCNVMRLGIGSEVCVFNGCDGEYRCLITEVSKKRCRLKIEQKISDFYASPDIWLLFAPLKKDNTDFLITKAVELGVGKLMPVITQYTVSSKIRPERWQIQMTEAAEQSRRMDIPEIAAEEDLKKVLEQWSADRKLFYFDESGNGIPICKAFAWASEDLCSNQFLKPVTAEDVGDSILNENIISKTCLSCAPAALLIGPEGGFAEKELEILRNLPYTTGVTLGKRILRAETAAVAALSCWQALCGDWQ